ncbi:MAG TPA: hypothetical protein ENI23_05940 [bacterium]|nr:hypothetical protein [bacterium]
MRVYLKIEAYEDHEDDLYDLGPIGKYFGFLIDLGFNEYRLPNEDLPPINSEYGIEKSDLNLIISYFRSYNDSGESWNDYVDIYEFKNKKPGLTEDYFVQISIQDNFWEGYANLEIVKNSIQDDLGNLEFPEEDENEE